MRRRTGPAAANDAAVIESSWREPERFAVLFDRHAPYIHRYLARRAGPQVAGDLVAETFLAAFAQRFRYDLGHPDARPWLYGIATILIGQHRRNEARQYRIMQAVAAEPAVPCLPNRWQPMLPPRRCARCWARRWMGWRQVTGMCCSSSPGSS
ncbi:MAG TPA: sigma factor [Streptosporangiaceae bacterium]|nr:sigma factor [Streptosporangiaceae bacterium]